MTVSPQPAAQPTVVVAHPPSNNLGLAGFITSLLGIVSCGVLAPIGLLLSLIGLFKQPRGFAIAGTIIGLIGSIFLAIAGFTIVAGLLGLGTAVKNAAEALAAEQIARQAYVQLEQQKQTGKAIDTNAANLVVSAHKDPWGTPLRAEVAADGGITIITAGRDKKFDTADDVRFDEATLQAVPPTTSPTTRAAD
jgi:type II secretory pathway pseudopilin PulG